MVPRRVRSSSPDPASGRTVIVALAANLLVALAKGVAAALTGSAALAAETAHSVADSANELMLYAGVRHARRPRDDQHPFGYGRATYFWALLAAVGIFVVGGLAAIYEGVQSIRRPEPLLSVPIGVIVLVVSAIFEAASWRTAHRQLEREADARHLDLVDHVQTSSNPTPSTVFIEDSAALIGIGLALAALLLHAATGSALSDGIASLLIGMLLIVAAYLLARRNAALLIGESTPAALRQRLAGLVASEPWVAQVADLTAVWTGPDQVLVLVRVVPMTGAGLVDNIERLRRRLLELPTIGQVEITPVMPKSRGCA